MTEPAVEDFLEHYGKKGMKWGVRRELKKLGSSSSRWEYIVTKDSRWLDKKRADPKLTKINKLAARDAKRQTKQLKKTYKEAGLNIKKPGLARTRYDNELKDVLTQSVDRASYRVHGSSPTGLREVQVYRHPDGSMSATVGFRDNAKIRRDYAKIAKSDARRAKRSPVNNAARDAIDTTLNPMSYNRTKTRLALNTAAAGATVGRYLLQSDVDDSALTHAEVLTAEDFEGMPFLFILDDEGFVDDILTPFDDEGDEDLEQSSIEDAADFIAHYGVRGMKWGVRKKSKSRPSFMPPVKKSTKPAWQSPPPKKVAPAPAPKSKRGLLSKPPKKTKLVSEDAAQIRDLRIKVKREGLQSLNNKDIELINKRAEVVSKYNKAYPKKPSLTLMAANLVVDGILSEEGSKKVVEFIAGPQPRPLRKDKQAEVLNQLLTTGRTVRKATKASKTK